MNLYSGTDRVSNLIPLVGVERQWAGRMRKDDVQAIMTYTLI